MRILVTGGAGYIGSQTCKELAKQGHEVVVYDNLSTGHREMVKWGVLEHGDILDQVSLRRVMHTHRIEGVIHFAAKLLVEESVRNPGLYMRNNIGGTLNILEAMRDENVPYLVVSGTCAVYGQPTHAPVSEDAPFAPLSPYGESKAVMEWMLRDFGKAYGLHSVALRYFNAAGSDFDGDCGEWHVPEIHLIPRAMMAIAGVAPSLDLFGDDYPTPDGTCVRDYIHVQDLATAHLAAMKWMAEGNEEKTSINHSTAVNLGTGKGLSVREIIQGIEQITGKKVPFQIKPRRAGDPPALFADARRAKDILKWEAKVSSLPEIVESAWKWLESRNFFQK